MHASAFGFLAAGGWAAWSRMYWSRVRPRAPMAPTCRKVRRFSGGPTQRDSKFIGRTPVGAGREVSGQGSAYRSQADSRPVGRRSAWGGRRAAAGSGGGHENNLAVSFSQVEDSRVLGRSQFIPPAVTEFTQPVREHIRTSRNQRRS